MAQVSPVVLSSSSGTAVCMCSSSSSSSPSESFCLSISEISDSRLLSLADISGTEVGVKVSLARAVGALEEVSAPAAEDPNTSLRRAFASAGDVELSPIGVIAASSCFTLPGLLFGAVLIPPSDGNPMRSLCALHDLYFVAGNRSSTSSCDMSFFSLRRRCGRGMVCRSTVSSSPFARARCRALYRKQYLTPTMILKKAQFFCWSQRPMEWLALQKNEDGLP